MKKILISIALITGCFAETLLPPSKANEIIKSTSLTKKFLEAEKRGQLKILGVVEDDNFYVITLKTKAGKGYVYLTKDKKYLIMGNVLNANTGKPYVSHALPLIDKNVVKSGVSFTGGNPNAKTEIYIVTDPECPYCKKLESEKGEILSKNYKIHYILFPLSFHKNAKAMSYYILSGKTDKEKEMRLKEVLRGSNKWKNYSVSESEKKRIDKQLEKSKKAVEELGAKGTPSIFDSNYMQVR